MFKQLLVAVDGSAHSSRAVKVAAELAHQMESRLLLLHVIRDLPLPKELQQMIDTGEVMESRLEILKTSAEIIFQNATKIARQEKVAEIESEIREGDPATEIVAAAEGHHADLIIMGTRGLSDLKGMFMGSVTRKVNNLSTIHCLTVK
ncbi:MAG: universal stress protein [SAR324 cluster bacterium]|nr:universal stress protein [SAR324 cluster bacterium]